MRCTLKIRPYEKIKGSTNELYKMWNERIKKQIKEYDLNGLKENIKNVIKDFDMLEINNYDKPKVGLVGEILVKFHPTANNRVIEIVENEGAEAVMPDLTDFFLYCAYNSKIKYQNLIGNELNDISGQVVISFIEYYRKIMKEELNKSNRFTAPKDIEYLGKLASKVLSLCNQTGEGWFLTAEMIELIESGVNNIICMQPFACLPNHVTGKGMIKAIKRKYESSNIIPIDYDPGASEANQINRIKLMLSVAKRNMNNIEKITLDEVAANLNETKS